MTPSGTPEERFDDCMDSQDICRECFLNAVSDAREKGFHEGKEFAIVTIGNAMTSSVGAEVPFLAFRDAAKALRSGKETRG